MIETKEQYEESLFLLRQWAGDEHSVPLGKTIEALREVARAAKLVNRAYYPGEKLHGLLEALPEWMLEP